MGGHRIQSIELIEPIFKSIKMQLNNKCIHIIYIIYIIYIMLYCSISNKIILRRFINYKY